MLPLYLFIKSTLRTVVLFLYVCPYMGHLLMYNLLVSINLSMHAYCNIKFFICQVYLKTLGKLKLHLTILRDYYYP